MLLLQRKCKPVDDGPEHLKEFRYTVMSFCFVDEPVKQVVHLSSNESAQVEKLPVDAVQNGFQEVSFARILRVEQIQKLTDEPSIDVLLRHVGHEIARLEEAEVELVNNLKVNKQDFLEVFQGSRIEKIYNLMSADPLSLYRVGQKKRSKFETRPFKNYTSVLIHILTICLSLTLGPSVQR